jgi:hypothetical protein
VGYKRLVIFASCSSVYDKIGDRQIIDSFGYALDTGAPVHSTKDNALLVQYI